MTTKEQRAVRKLRGQLASEQNYKCAYCGKRCEDRDITLEHLQARSHGGITKYLNCVMACVRCNSHRATSNPTSFYKKIKAAKKPNANRSLDF